MNSKFGIFYTGRCRNCKLLQENHAEGRCLFEATRFEHMSEEEWDLWQKERLEELKSGEILKFHLKWSITYD